MGNANTVGCQKIYLKIKYIKLTNSTLKCKPKSYFENLVNMKSKLVENHYIFLR